MHRKHILFPLPGALAATAILAVATSSASAKGFFLAAELGFSAADFSDPIFADGDGINPSGDDAVISGGLFAGYEWASDVFLETGIQGYGSLSPILLGDSLEISAVRAALGYNFPGESKLRAFGKAGVNFWELESRESFLLNPGPEEVSTIDGTDLFAQLGLEYRFSDRWRAGASLAYSDFDVGSATSFNLSLKFLP